MPGTPSISAPRPPLCPECSMLMDLKLVMPTQDGGDEYWFSCPHCKHTQTLKRLTSDSPLGLQGGVTSAALAAHRAERP